MSADRNMTGRLQFCNLVAYTGKGIISILSNTYCIQKGVVMASASEALSSLLDCFFTSFVAMTGFVMHYQKIELV